MSKSSNINLYSSDLLTEKALEISSTDAKVTFLSPNEVEFNQPKVSLKGHPSGVSFDIEDLASKLKSMVDLEASNHLSQAALITANTNSIATLDARESADSASISALLGAETAARSTADTNLTNDLNSEVTRATAAEGVLTSNLTQEIADRTAADSSEQARAIAAETSLQSQIDTLVGTDSTTLTQINQMLTDYQAADNSLSNLVSSLDTRLTALEAQVATLTA